MLRILVIFWFALTTLSAYSQTNPTEIDTTISYVLEEPPPMNKSLLKNGDISKTPSLTLPYISYNDNDGIGFGALFMEDILGVGVIAMPTIGRKSGTINGNALILKNLKTESNKPIRTGLFVRTMSIDNNEKFDFTRRGSAFTPFIDFTLYKSDSIDSQKAKVLSFQPIFVIEEFANFDAGKYTGNNAFRFFIPTINYQSTKTSEKRNTALNISLEGSRYKTIGNNSEHYMKTTINYESEYKYHSSYNGWLKLRFFGAGFPINSQQNSTSYQNIFTRGSIAMIHQGYNDYTYSQAFLSRQNQSLNFDNQVSISQGGGFKTAFGSAYSFGLSNNFALSVNGRVGIPWKLKLPLFGYFDTGAFSVFEGEKYVTKSMTNIGIGAHLGNIFHVFLPVLYSKELGNIHSSQHPEWYQRVSFAIEVNSLTKWYRNKVEKNIRRFSI